MFHGRKRQTGGTYLPVRVHNTSYYIVQKFLHWEIFTEITTIYKKVQKDGSHECTK